MTREEQREWLMEEIEKDAQLYRKADRSGESNKWGLLRSPRCLDQGRSLFRVLGQRRRASPEQLGEVASGTRRFTSRRKGLGNGIGCTGDFDRLPIGHDHGRPPAQVHEAGGRGSVDRGSAAGGGSFAATRRTSASRSASPEVWGRSTKSAGGASHPRAPHGNPAFREPTGYYRAPTEQGRWDRSTRAARPPRS
jgi:hypothetical protein